MRAETRACRRRRYRRCAVTVEHGDERASSRPWPRTPYAPVGRARSRSRGAARRDVGWSGPTAPANDHHAAARRNMAPSAGEASVAVTRSRRMQRTIKTRIGYISALRAVQATSPSKRTCLLSDLYEVSVRSASREDACSVQQSPAVSQAACAATSRGGMKQKLGLGFGVVVWPHAESCVLDERQRRRSGVAARLLAHPLQHGEEASRSSSPRYPTSRAPLPVWTDESRRLVLCDTPQRLKGALGGLLIEWETPTLRRPRSPRAASGRIGDALGRQSCAAPSTRRSARVSTRCWPRRAASVGQCIAPRPGGRVHQRGRR